MIHPNPDALLAEQWQQWSIPLEDLTAKGVDVAAIRKLHIGIGDADNPQSGGIGIIYVDNIRVIQSMPNGN